LNLQVQEVSVAVVVGTTEKFANENYWNLVSRWQRTWHTAGSNLPPTCNITGLRYEKHTCSRRVKLLYLKLNEKHLITHMKMVTQYIQVYRTITVSLASTLEM